MIKKKKNQHETYDKNLLYVVVYSSVLLSRSVSLKISSLDSCVRCSPDAENGRPEEGGKKKKNDTPHFEPSFISPLKPEGCQKFARRGVTLVYPSRRMRASVPSSLESRLFLISDSSVLHWKYRSRLGARRGASVIEPYQIHDGSRPNPLASAPSPGSTVGRSA